MTAKEPPEFRERHNMKKYTGTIKFYSQKKKYGFIKYLYDDKEIFFHISDVYSGNKEKLYKGCTARFLLSENQKTKKEKSNKYYNFCG